MKFFLSISALILYVVSYGQRNYIYGLVRDSTTQEEMPGVHVKNINAGLLTSANINGKFKIPAQMGDTIVLSSVGYKTLAWIVEENWFDIEFTTFSLPINTIYLEEVVVDKYPEYERFKDQLTQMDIEDSTFEVYGVPRVVLSKNASLNASLSISGPFSMMHNAFSKRAKEKRKMRQLLKEQDAQEKVRQKFTREWVAESTKLGGDTLTNFIDYCNFTQEYLINTPEYIIHEDMMALLPHFLEEYKNKY
ncbi:MAG: carboxypeptidase-like regulatory domain-containing protein [Bacteroidota bacterium]